MDATGICRLECLAGTVDIRFQSTREATDSGILDGFGDGLYRLEVARAGDRKTRLDHVHTHLFQGARDTDLLVLGHGRAGTLLAVAQGGIEND